MNAEPTKQPQPEPATPELKKTTSFYLGVTALVLSVVAPLLALLVPLLKLPTGLAAALAGLLVAGVPEVLILLAVALLGKQTVDYFRHVAARWIRSAARIGPVSRARYYTGLVIAVATAIPSYLYGYLPEGLPSGTDRVRIMAAADLAFLLSVFIMGGEFWGKFRQIFIWEGRG